MKYSPKLKTAMKEIEAVIKKHDIAAYVVLHTPGFSEYMSVVDPSYSALKKNNATGEVQIKGKLEHYDGNKGLRDLRLAETRNMLEHFRDMLALGFDGHDRLAAKMDETFGKWDHEPGTHTTSQDQDN